MCLLHSNADLPGIIDVLWPARIPGPTAPALFKQRQQDPEQQSGARAGPGSRPSVAHPPIPGRMREDPTSRMGWASSDPRRTFGFLVIPASSSPGFLRCTRGKTQRQDPEARPRGKGQYKLCLFMVTVSGPCCSKWDPVNRAHLYKPQLN